MIRKASLRLLLLLFVSPWIAPRTSLGAEGDLKAVVTGAFVSAGSMDSYEHLVAYLSGKVGNRITIARGATYGMATRLLRDQEVQLGFLCGYNYVKEKDAAHLELLVAPVPANPKYEARPIYFSYVIVPADSPAKSFDDLKGARYLFSDSLSNSGFNIPRYELAKKGTTPQRFFKEVKFSGSHEKSIEMVANKQADGASVDSLVWDWDSVHSPASTSKTRVVAEHAAGGIVPVVVIEKMDPALKSALKAAFLGMSSDPEGRALLEKLLLKEFVDVADSHYDGIREKERVGLEMEKGKE